jgi:hypothetical protein
VKVIRKEVTVAAPIADVWNGITSMNILTMPGAECLQSWRTFQKAMSINPIFRILAEIALFLPIHIH